jgi:hypothetical protein
MKFSAVLGVALAGALVGQTAWAAPVEGTRVAFVEVPRLLQDAPQVAAVRDNLKK